MEAHLRKVGFCPFSNISVCENQGWEQQRFDFLEDKADILKLSHPNLNPMAQVAGQWPENISKMILQDYFKLRKTRLSNDFYVLVSLWSN